MVACSLISCQASIPPITLNNVVTACGSGDCKSENSSTNNTAANQSQGFGADAGLNGNISLDGGFGVGGGAGNGDSGNGGGNNLPPFDAGRTDSGISDAGGGDLESGFTFVNSRYPGDTLPPMDDPLECNPIHSGSGIPDIQGQYLFIPIKGDINADICQGFPPTGGPSLFDITQTGDCLSLSQRGVSTHVKAGVTLRAKNNYLKALFRNQENQGGYPVTGVDIHDLTIKGDNEILADVLLIRTFPQDPSTGQCSARVSGRLIRVPDDCGTVTAASLEYGSATTPGTVADSDWYGSSVTLRGRTENTLCNVPAQTINFSPGVGIFINPAGATANGCVRMVASALNVFECNGMVFPLPGTAKEFGFICNAPIQSGVRTLTAQLFGVLAPNSTASGGVLQVVIPLLSDTPNPFNEYCHVSIRGNLGPVADSSPLSYRFASHFIQELKPLHAVERRFETVNDNGDLPDIWVAGKDPNILEFDKAAVTAAATLNPVGYSEIRGMHLGTDGVLRVVGNSADGKARYSHSADHVVFTQDTTVPIANNNSDRFHDIVAVKVGNTLHAWIVGEGRQGGNSIGKVWYYTGSAWRAPWEITDAAPLRAVHAVVDAQGILMLAVGGNGTLVRSLDGAAPVKLNGLVSQMSTDQLNDIWFHDRNWVLAAGNQGLYSRDSTGAWSKVLVPGLGSFPRFNAVTGLLTDDGAMEVWAAGGFGGVVRLANSSGSYTTDSQTGTFIIPFGGLDSQFKNATINRMTGYSKKAGGKTIETHYVLAGEVKNPDGTSTLGSFWTIRSLNPAKPGPAIPTP